jgi:4-diphosphocytidyl-2-C-methyl-D-erythritol kinase
MHLSERAPAKVNLSLLVGPRLENGYHELFTVFVPVDVYDELEFDVEARPPRGGAPRNQLLRPGVVASGAGAYSLQVVCSAIEGEANLAVRALRAIESHTGWAFEGQVHVRKHIPVGAGLGGGSSNAAVSLLAGARVLTEAGGPALGQATLRALARVLGADVAFFLDPRPSIGQGIGELLEPLTLPVMHLVLVYLDHHLSTGSVYESFDALGAVEAPGSFSARVAAAKVSWLALSHAVTCGGLDETSAPQVVVPLLENDLEEASFGLFSPPVDAKRALMEEGALGALMSGSGSTVFGICETRAAAKQVCEAVQRQGFNARTVLAGTLP